jgi:hypothetical protein
MKARNVMPSAPQCIVINQIFLALASPDLWSGFLTIIILAYFIQSTSSLIFHPLNVMIEVRQGSMKLETRNWKLETGSWRTGKKPATNNL